MSKISTTILSVTLLLLLPFAGINQSSTPAIALNRQLFHENVRKVQNRLLTFDSQKQRGTIANGGGAGNEQIKEALTARIDDLLIQIETNGEISHNKKLRYLRGLGETLLDFLDDISKKKAKMGGLPILLEAWQAAYHADSRGESLGPVIRRYPYAVGKILLKSMPFAQSESADEAKNSLRMRIASERPDQALYVLNEMPEVSFADSLIRVALKYNPSSIYTFAQAGQTPIGQRIRQMDEPGIKLLVALSENSHGQLLLPFYDELLLGNMKQDTIEAVMNDSLAYYKLLVSTAITYAGRTLKGDTPAVWKPMRTMLHAKAIFPFVNTINALHSAGDGVRFRIIEKLSPQELYYLIISSEEEIYTSSYVGAYRRIWQRMKPANGDSLLQKVNYDHYKKFITLAANYNTLDHFLGSMGAGAAASLMQQFVRNLDNGRFDDLEDAVDVANSFASIKNDSLKADLLIAIKNQYDSALLTNNKKAQIIYRLEHLILSSSLPGSDISLPDSLGIEPVFSMPHRRLLTDTGHIIGQVFFYDDPMVLGIYGGFLRSFNRQYWKVVENEQWVTVSSRQGTPVTIFANRASPKENGTDERTQRALMAWLQSNNLKPTITIHRGHSYVTNSTIAQLSPNSKIVFLGSCGGYHLIRSVLNTAPDAHIIATKQIGRTAINRPFFQLLAEKIRTGQDVDWIPFWKQLSGITGGNGFEDYIPPHKMLGAIFIKAYNRIGSEDW